MSLKELFALWQPEQLLILKVSLRRLLRVQGSVGGTTLIILILV